MTTSTSKECLMCYHTYAASAAACPKCGSVKVLDRLADQRDHRTRFIAGFSAVGGMIVWGADFLLNQTIPSLTGSRNPGPLQPYDVLISYGRGVGGYLVGAFFGGALGWGIGVLGRRPRPGRSM
jgi:hypothetical protein